MFKILVKPNEKKNEINNTENKPILKLPKPLTTEFIKFGIIE